MFKKLKSLIILGVFAFLFNGSAVFADTTSTFNLSNLDVFFYSTTSGGAVSANVPLPWTANVGSGNQNFWLNKTTATITPSNLTFENGINGVSGRLVVELTPLASGQKYLCQVDLTYETPSTFPRQLNCLSEITLFLTDGSTRKMSFPLFGGVSSNSPYRAIYFSDFNFSLNGKKISYIGWTVSKLGSNDIYSAVSSPFAVLRIDDVRGTINQYNDGTSDYLQQQINQQQTIINQQTQTNEKLDQLNSSIISSYPPSNQSELGNAVGWLPPGPADSILTLPLTLLNGLISAFSSEACSDLIVPLPFLTGSTITLPCMRPIFQQMGVTIIYEAIGSVISAFLLFKFMKWLYKFADDTLTMRENNSGLWGGF